MRLLSIVVVLAIVSCGQSHRVFTKKDLAKFDGSDPAEPIYIAVMGEVYDVTEGRGFYGKGGDYEVFGGRDVTRAVSLWTKDQKEIDRGNDTNGLDMKQIKKLNEIIKMLKGKYKVIGIMDYKAKKLAEKEKLKKEQEEKKKQAAGEKEKVESTTQEL